ncbi:hypothetical protein FPQ18DRAFT_368773 [Pyronema domesticum]|nr:hypothetical protein FPQ18DRAFT_368773 [Pyronema domesticum]
MTTPFTALEKRQLRCALPKHPDIVPVTPHLGNHGWANSWDRPCRPGLWCQYACVPGKLMHQWDPTATAYRHPESERGGLYCGADGIARKPYPNRGYCYTAPRKVPVLNLNSKQVHICQTVLPGDEAMRIPNRVAPGHSVGLAVPGQEYWIDSGAHYYVNFPGTPLNEACVWGNRNKPSGNWAPYILALKLRDDGEIFVTLGWNPVWLEYATPFRNAVPNFGVKVVCKGSGCKNTPCTIDPAVNRVNSVSHPQNQFSGAGGASACVATADRRSTIKIILFPRGKGHIY